MNLGEHFTSISKVESYLYEWYFHPYVTPPKASSVNVGAPIVQAPQLSESDSPQLQNPLSIDNNKGSSTQSPPKPTHNLVLTKDK